MKRLLLLRHAKAEVGSISAKDADRALNEVGRKAAARMGRYMNVQNHKPGIVLCSDAVRTKQTLEIVQNASESRAAVEYRPDLYLAEAEHLLTIVRSLSDNLPSAMFVGHNPGIGELALWLTRAPMSREEEAAHKRMREKFSTCAFAVLEFDAGRWLDVRPATARLADFVRPKDLD